uniref:Uncharacterized protein n=1 Tax=Octopus bimaculoides TaxID=37653 RepID=A0A0L8GEW5_OCTBM
MVLKKNDIHFQTYKTYGWFFIICLARFKDLLREIQTTVFNIGTKIPKIHPTPKLLLCQKLPKCNQLLY